MATSARTFEAKIETSSNNQDKFLKLEEHCRATPRQLASIGRASGEQVRLRLEGREDFLFTVRDTESAKAILRLAEKALARLGAQAGQKLIVSNRVPHPKLTAALAKQQGEFIERLTNRPEEDHLVAIAPHGGLIEKYTDKQAERVGTLLSVTCWRCRGYQTKGGAGASARWHITSTDIHEASFPLLGKIIDRDFANAVSFHGFSQRDEEEAPADILIGGGADDDWKLRMQELLMRALPKDIIVELAAPGSRLAGKSKRNIVNRLARKGNGIQLEQSMRARDKHWEAIADAVASVYTRNRPVRLQGAAPRRRSIPAAHC